MSSTRIMPSWVKDVKKWMGDQGAMTNLQIEFVCYLEDSLIQPLRKEALRQKQLAELANAKSDRLLKLTDELAEENARLQMEINKPKYTGV
jgi:hypothetical protein